MSNGLKPRRIILDLAVSFDGFIEGPKGEVDWCVMDINFVKLHFGWRQQWF